VFFGIPGDADPNLGVALPQKTDQFGGVAKPADRRLEDFPPVRRIAPEGHDVADAALGRQIEPLFDLAAICVDASKVGGGCQAEAFLNFDAPVDGPRPRAATRTISARHKHGAIRSQPAECAEQSFVPVGRFRGKNLDRHAAPAVAVDFTDAHSAFHSAKPQGRERKLTAVIILTG